MNPEESEVLAVEKIEHTEVEIEQMEEGWIPPERQDQVEGKKFLTAEEYKERGTFFKKIKTLNEKVEAQDKVIDQINEHHNKVTANELKKQKAEYEDTIERLKAEKVQALDEGDHTRVVNIDEQIRTTKEPIEPSQAPYFDTWVKENTWYTDDEFLAMEADIMAREHQVRQTPAEVALPKIAEHLKMKYPDKFTNPKRQEAGTVETGSPAPSKKNVSEKDLTAEELSMFKDLGMSKYLKTDEARKKYIQEVISLRD